DKEEQAGALRSPAGPAHRGIEAAVAGCKPGEGPPLKALWMRGMSMKGVAAGRAAANQGGTAEESFRPCGQQGGRIFDVREEACDELPRADFCPKPLLGGAGVRGGAALRYGSGGRNVSPVHFPAGPGTRALENRLRAAVPPAYRRALRREPQPPAALPSISGAPQSVSRHRARHVP